ncbi:MFS transporter [Pollutimonas thiosulfatoxidans]|uniref:MFS transporter n=1 Tax=Pollutimonas thiosulfatoxidans TaxID=2028345 RepID=A0A410G9N4_9BURK|nr:MFS transporter [Pollutimonas thiosulfatoxidans]NYT45061.1 MFS transporter [Alcaligenaceae bacterium]QAA93028.1 MFS transporter [Pollutimonas thiosulfatoxidans]
MNRKLFLLALCQGLFLTNNVTFIAINGLVGLALAPLSWLATLPVTAYVVGAALSTGPVARSQRQLGRKRSFQIGLVVAAVSAGICAWAAATGQFWLLVTATFIAGYYSANASLYRFAAPELAAPSYKEKAISLVLAGGIVGAVVGPNLANITRSLLPTPFVGAYLALIVVALLSLLIMTCIDFPRHIAPAPGTSTGRSLRNIARQPVFLVAVAGASLGYAVMNLLMAATPLAMQMHAHPFGNIAIVLELHVLGMFLPSFFTGHLIKRFGVLPIMGTGVALMFICVAIALSGISLMQFTIALLTLGVGWNFLYIGGSTLLTEAYHPDEKNKAQGAMDFCVFTCVAVSSFASGVLITTQGWMWINLGSLVPLLVISMALWWMARQRLTAVAQR